MQQESKTTFIYTLSCPLSNDIRYVGKSDNIKNRIRDHLSKSKKLKTHKDKWICSLNKNHSKPKLEILDIVDKNEWKFWEQHYISLFKSWGFNLVNHTNGGDGGSFKKHTEETKKKMSQLRKGKKRKPFSEETKKAMSESAKKRAMPLKAIQTSANKRRGKKRPPMSESTKEKLRNYRLNKIHTKETIEKIKNNSSQKIKILCINNNKIYNSISEASAELKLFSSNIVDLLRGRRNTVKGYKFIKFNNETK